MSGDFPIIFLLLISSLIPLWLENTLYMISIHLNLLRFVWPGILVHLDICYPGT